MTTYAIPGARLVFDPTLDRFEYQEDSVFKIVTSDPPADQDMGGSGVGATTTVYSATFGTTPFADLSLVTSQSLRIFSAGPDNTSTVYVAFDPVSLDAYIYVLDGDPIDFEQQSNIDDVFDTAQTVETVSRETFLPTAFAPFSAIEGLELTEADEVTGSAGADTIAVGIGDDEVSGGEGDDGIDGGVGDDRLFGGPGDDTLNGDAGEDTLNGGQGADTLDGGTGGDRLTGGDGDDRLIGSDGDDLLIGAAGKDTLIGGVGDDRLLGGVGTDRLVGGAGDDRLLGKDDRDRLDGGDGADTLFGGKGKDDLLGGAGNDRMFGQTGGDELNGDDGADELKGGSGNDTLDGGSGRDMLLGGNGRDTLVGGKGADLLKGGKGNDLLTGAAGADTFEFTGPVRQDTITDFRDDKDTLLLDQELWGGGLTVEELVDTQGVVTADGFVLTFNSKNSILLEGVTDGALLYNDIEFL